MIFSSCLTGVTVRFVYAASGAAFRRFRNSFTGSRDSRTRPMDVQKAGSLDPIVRLMVKMDWVLMRSMYRIWS